ncbi:hypothetical protein TcCL_ESM08697 [Trypanosoma cruzi]|nr:hypothetical protein TcCL_ESM08697 [Trypanosoma cruzi]
MAERQEARAGNRDLCVARDVGVDFGSSRVKLFCCCPCVWPLRQRANTKGRDAGAACVCVQVPCNNVTANMLRLGDPHIVVVLTNSPGTAHTDALSGRSEASLRRCREQDVLTQPRRAWSVTIAQSAVAGGIFTSRRQQRGRESCSCCWRRCCLLWPPMPIIFCPLIMGGMPPLVTSSAGISQHQ